ncbi:MAG: hypothetical protein AAFW69_05755 [Pseudomonadota bacterium]
MTERMEFDRMMSLAASGSLKCARGGVHGATRVSIDETRAMAQALDWFALRERALLEVIESGAGPAPVKKEESDVDRDP